MLPPMASLEGFTSGGSGGWGFELTESNRPSCSKIIELLSCSTKNEQGYGLSRGSSSRGSRAKNATKALGSAAKGAWERSLVMPKAVRAKPGWLIWEDRQTKDYRR